MKVAAQFALIVTPAYVDLFFRPTPPLPPAKRRRKTGWLLALKGEICFGLVWMTHWKVSRHFFQSGEDNRIK
jgi:hypothetical protein